MIKLKQLLVQANHGDKYKAIESFQGHFNSNTRNYRGEVRELPVGAIIQFESTAPNSNSWFMYKNERFKVELSSPESLVKWGNLKKI